MYTDRLQGRSVVWLIVFFLFFNPYRNEGAVFSVYFFISSLLTLLIATGRPGSVLVFGFELVEP